jgi:hypothetical protein
MISLKYLSLKQTTSSQKDQTYTQMVRVKQHTLTGTSSPQFTSFSLEQMQKGKIYMHRSKTMWIGRKFSSKFPGHFTFYNLVKSKKFAIPVKDIIAQIPNEDCLIPYFEQRKRLMSESSDEAEFVNIHFVNPNPQLEYSGEAQVMSWDTEYITVDLFDQQLIHYGYGELIKGTKGLKVRYEDICNMEAIDHINKWVTDEARQCDCPPCENMDFLEQHAQRQREEEEQLERAIHDEWVVIENERKRKREEAQNGEGVEVRRSERLRNKPRANYNF